MSKSILSVIVFIITLFSFTSCTKDDNKTTDTADYSEILRNTGTNVILKTYESLATEAALLYQAIQVLESNPNQANLDAAKAAWVATRAPWEQSEGFIFGPVDQEGLDPSLDSWPVNVIDLNNVLNSSNQLNEAFLAQQEGTLKGFHTVEFLLWGENGDKKVDEFTPRQFEYLAAAADVLRSDAQKLYDLWKPAGGNFINNILKAGNGSQVYISQKAALEEITNALIIIADEVANGKINDPLSQKDLTLEESQFSNNSKADFSNNIISIKNIYTGTFGNYGNGRSVSEIIKEKNASLDVKVKAEIEAAILSITSISGTFSEAIFNNTAAVTSAQTKVRTLQNTLGSQVLPIISNL